jgi:hypothetical protein
MDMHKKRRRGPVPKPESEQRRNRRAAYFSDAELAHLVGQVFPNGIENLSPQMINRGIGRYIRETILGSVSPSVPAINQQAWVELSRTAANLNQAMRLANEVGDADLAFHAERVKFAVSEFRNQLVGLEIPHES